MITNQLLYQLSYTSDMEILYDLMNYLSSLFCYKYFTDIIERKDDATTKGTG